DVLGDLDAHDLAPLPRLAGQLERASDAGVREGEGLQLVVDLGERAVGGAAAREGGGTRADTGGRGAAGALLGEAVAAVAGLQVAEDDLVAVAGLLELGLVAAAVQQRVPVDPA